MISRTIAQSGNGPAALVGLLIGLAISIYLYAQFLRLSTSLVNKLTSSSGEEPMPEITKDDAMTISVVAMIARAFVYAIVAWIFGEGVGSRHREPLLSGFVPNFTFSILCVFTDSMVIARLVPTRSRRALAVSFVNLVVTLTVILAVTGLVLLLIPSARDAFG